MFARLAQTYAETELAKQLKEKASPARSYTLRTRTSLCSFRKNVWRLVE
jgi:hypothetical protein